MALNSQVLTKFHKNNFCGEDPKDGGGAKKHAERIKLITTKEGQVNVRPAQYTSSSPN